MTDIFYRTGFEKANPYHDRETGRFTTAEGGWVSASAGSLTVPDGGFTVMGGKSIDSGYAVSPYPERSRKFSSEGASRAQITSEIRSYAEANGDLLSQPGNAIGGWHDPATGDIYLDVSIITDTPELAAKVALEHDQIAYFDFQTFESVTVNPDAKSGQQH